MSKTNVIDKAEKFVRSANSMAKAADWSIGLSQAVLAAGMLLNEGLHAVADSIEKIGDLEVTADTIANAIKLLE
jgi:hypothetical protein